jgi:hypothetical protein
MFRDLRDESQPPQIVFCPTGSDEKMTDHVGRKRIACSVIVNDHATTIRMPIDALIALSFRELKPFPFKCPDDTARCDIPQQGERRMRLGHSVIATTGAVKV